MLKNGLYFGLASIALGVITYVMGISLKQTIILGLLGLVIMAVFIVLGIKQFKNENSGFLSIGQAIKIGIGIALVGAVISAVYNIIFRTIIDPDYVLQMVEMQKTQMAEYGVTLPEEEWEKILEEQKQTSSIILASLWSVLGMVFVGFIVSLISGAVMQKKETSL